MQPAGVDEILLGQHGIQHAHLYALGGSFAAGQRHGQLYLVFASGRALYVHPYAVPLSGQRAGVALVQVYQHVGVEAGRLAQVIVVGVGVHGQTHRHVDHAAHAHIVGYVGLYLDLAERVPAGVVVGLAVRHLEGYGLIAKSAEFGSVGRLGFLIQKYLFQCSYYLGYHRKYLLFKTPLARINIYMSMSSSTGQWSLPSTLSCMSASRTASFTRSDVRK